MSSSRRHIGCRVSFRVLPLAMLLVLASASARGRGDSASSPPAPAEVLASYMKGIDTVLPRSVRAALGRIPSTSRRLLAMKYYLRRSEEEIARKWAWSAEEIRRHRR